MIKSKDSGVMLSGFESLYSALLSCETLAK